MTLPLSAPFYTPAGRRAQFRETWPRRCLWPRRHFRNISAAPIDPRDPEARARSNAQLEALDQFWRRYFADRGVFLAAYDEYRSLEEFAHRVEVMKPQRISGMEFLRRAIFRPASEGADVFLGLAQVLTGPSDNESVGLSELIAKGQDAVQLAKHLRGSDPGYLFANALGRLTEAGRKLSMSGE